MVEKKLVSMNLTEQDLAAIENIADERGITKTDAVRGAIATEEFLRSELNKGAKILIQDPNGSIRELFIRR